MSGLMKDGQMIRIAQRMIAKGNSFECALGAAMTEGDYKARSKITSAFPRVIERFKSKIHD